MTFKRFNIERPNKFLFGDNDLSNEVIVEKINRQLLPSISNISVKTPKSNGRKFQRTTLDTRLITVTLRFVENEYEKVQERVLKVSSLLHSKEPKKLVLRDSDKFNYAIVSQITDVEKTIFTGICDVVFECHDIYNYGATKVFNVGDEIVNSGTAPATGKLKLVTADADMISVTLNGGPFLRFDTSFVSGANLEIDLENEYTTINGSSLMDKLTFDSDFFEIPIGINGIEVVGASGTIEFTERWL